MNLGVLAKSGWGKSYLAQSIQEENIPDYDHVVILDEGDEYTGLVEHFEELRRWGVGHREAAASVGKWQTFLETNEWVQLPRHDLKRGDWKETCNRIVGATRRLDGTVLVVIDEAQLVAPQKTQLPEHIDWLGTTGRKNGYSTIIITQRPAKLDKDVLSQMMGLYLGGFGEKSDRNQLDPEYPVGLHDPTLKSISRVPEELYPDDIDPSEPCPPLRKWSEGEGDNETTIGSEWIYSDDDGDMERINTRTDVSMASTHYAPEAENLRLPGVG
jgi:hypothetical protein